MGIFNDQDDHTHHIKNVTGYVAGIPGKRGFTGPAGPKGEKGDAGLTEREVKNKVTSVVELIRQPNPFALITSLNTKEGSGGPTIQLTSSQTPIKKTSQIPQIQGIDPFLAYSAGNTFDIRTPTIINENNNFTYDYSLSIPFGDGSGGDIEFTIFYDLYVWETPHKVLFELVNTPGIVQIGSMTHNIINDVIHRIRTTIKPSSVSGQRTIKTKFVLTYDNKEPTLDTNGELICNLSVYGTGGNPSFDLPNPKDEVFSNSTIGSAFSSKDIFQKGRIYYTEVKPPPRSPFGNGGIVPNFLPTYGEVADKIKEELKGWFEKEYVRLLPFPGITKTPEAWRSITLERTRPPELPDLPIPPDKKKKYLIPIVDFEIDKNLSEFDKAKTESTITSFGVGTNPTLSQIMSKNFKYPIFEKRMSFHVSLRLTGLTSNLPPGKGGIIPVPNGVDPGTKVGLLMLTGDGGISQYSEKLYSTSVEPPTTFEYQGYFTTPSNLFTGQSGKLPCLYVYTEIYYDSCTLTITEQ